MGTKPSKPAPQLKYGANVVGKRCWIRFTLNDGTKACLGGKIDEFRCGAKNTSSEAEQATDDDATPPLLTWYHVIQFDNGQTENFDLDFEDRKSNLYWKDPMPDPRDEPTLPRDKVGVQNAWSRPNDEQELETNTPARAAKRETKTEQKNPRKRSANKMASAKKEKKSLVKKETQSRRPKRQKIAEEYGAEIVGRRVMCEWIFVGDEGSELHWLTGDITKYAEWRGRRYHVVEYENGQSCWHDAFVHGNKGLRFVQKSMVNRRASCQTLPTDGQTK